MAEQVLRGVAASPGAPRDCRANLRHRSGFGNIESGCSSGG
jgi:hypothetical protein